MSRLYLALLAGALLLLGANQARAQATIRLGGIGDATVQPLDTDIQADTEDVAWRGGRNRGGFYRGGRSYGYGRYYGGRYYAGYRPWFYRPYRYWPSYAYRPYRFYGYGYYGPSYYYPAYYGGASYYYNVPTYGVYASPSASETVTLPPATALSTSSYNQVITLPNGLTPERMPPPSTKVKRAGTYNYDGDPGHTVPMPIPEKLPAPTIRNKAATVPLEGRLVSLPSPAPK